MKLDTIGWEGDPLGIVQKIKIWPFYQMQKPESVLANETHEILNDFEIQTDHLISTKRLDLVIVNRKKENLLISGLCRLKENKKRDKYIDFACELKKYGTWKW